MKYIETGKVLDRDIPVLELTRRNLTALLEKLDDPNSHCTLIAPEGTIAVRAVEDSEHYKTRPPGVNLTNGVVT